MPTLANVQGGSLAPNLSGPLQIFTLLANQSRQKRAEEEAEAEALQALRTAGGLTASAESQGGLGGLLGPSPAQPGLTPDGDRAGLDGAVREALGQRAPPPANTKSTNVLGQVNPAVARQAAEVAARGSEVESAQFRNEATKGMALAKEMQKLPNFSAQRRRLGEMAADAIKEGTPEAQQRILQLMNMDEGQLALELTKMQVTGSGILAAVPEIKPTGPFRLFDTPEQRDGLARLMVINPQAAQVLVANRRDNIAQDRADAEAARIAAGPQSEFAQFAADIRTDVERGIIQPDVGERMIENARLKGTKELRAASAAAAKARAAAARPATDLGQSLAEIQRDLGRGSITEEQAEALRTRAVRDAEGVEDLDASTAVGKARQDFERGLITQEDLDKITNSPPEFQTEVGKTISDRQIALDTFGEDSPQVAAFDDAIEAKSSGDPPKLSDIAGLRREHTGLSKDFVTAQGAIRQINIAANNPSAAGDVALLFSFMKLLDPNSVVRESEFATAANSAGVPDRVRAQYNRALHGERLAQGTREDFVNTANSIFEGNVRDQRVREQTFREIAKRSGINPDDAVPTFVTGVGAAVPGIDLGAVGLGVRDGAEAINAEGVRIKAVGGRWLAQ